MFWSLVLRGEDFLNELTEENGSVFWLEVAGVLARGCCLRSLFSNSVSILILRTPTTEFYRNWGVNFLQLERYLSISWKINSNEVQETQCIAIHFWVNWLVMLGNQQINSQLFQIIWQSGSGLPALESHKQPMCCCALLLGGVFLCKQLRVSLDNSWSIFGFSASHWPVGNKRGLWLVNQIICWEGG